MVMFDTPYISEKDILALQKYLLLINHVFPVTRVVIKSPYSLNPVFYIIHGHNHMLDVFQVFTDFGFREAICNKAYLFPVHTTWMPGNYSLSKPTKSITWKIAFFSGLGC